MSIKFHCSQCGKKIEAPDTAGGKWGKCPACHNRIYVPQPETGEEEELRLAPVDEAEEMRQRQLMLETYRITHDILEERGIPEPAAGPGFAPPSDINEEKLTDYIIRYLRQMAKGDLDEAQRTADLIVPHRRKAATILEQFASSSDPDPELEDIPKQVLSGLIRNLRTRIS